MRNRKFPFLSSMDKYMDHLGVVTSVKESVTVKHKDGGTFAYDISSLMLLDPLTCDADSYDIHIVMLQVELSDTELLRSGTTVQCSASIPNNKLRYSFSKDVSGENFTVVQYDRERSSYVLKRTDGRQFMVERWFVIPSDKDDTTEEDDIVRAITDLESKFTGELDALKEKLAKRQKTKK